MSHRSMMSATAALGAAAIATLVACGGKGSATPASGTAKPAVAVEVATATPGEIVQSIDVVGQLAPKFAADVKTEFTAIVAEVYVAEWQQVRRGEPLARLDEREATLVVDAARASLLQAEVAETRATRELERARGLKEFGLATQQQVDDATSAAEAAAATTAAAKAQFGATRTRLEKAVIRAPFDGVVAYRGVSVGDRVENMGGGAMFTIIDNRILELTVNVPSSRMVSLRVGQPLEFTSEAAPGRTFTGSISFINPSVDQASRTVKVMAVVDNDDRALRSGLFVKGRIRTGVRSGVLQIPRVALQSWDVEHGRAEVFVVAGDTVEQRVVRTGEASSETVEIVEGLGAGDRVVTRGAFNLQAGDRVQAAAPEGA